jgi:hypothetical protein
MKSRRRTQCSTVVRRDFGGSKSKPINKQQANSKRRKQSVLLGCCLAYSLALNMEAVSFSETSVNFYRTTCRKKKTPWLWSTSELCQSAKVGTTCRNTPENSIRYANLCVFVKIGMEVMTVLACESLCVRLSIVETNMAIL